MGHKFNFFKRAINAVRAAFCLPATTMHSADSSLHDTFTIKSLLCLSRVYSTFAFVLFSSFTKCLHTSSYNFTLLLDGDHTPNRVNNSLRVDLKFSGSSKYSSLSSIPGCMFVVTALVGME